MYNSYGHTGHSAEIKMQLLINGSALPIAQSGPDFIVLREKINHAPTEATIVMQIDASARRWSVTLPEGTSLESTRVRTA